MDEERVGSEPVSSNRCRRAARASSSVSIRFPVLLRATRVRPTVDREKPFPSSGSSPRPAVRASNALDCVSSSRLTLTVADGAMAEEGGGPRRGRGCSRDGEGCGEGGGRRSWRAWDGDAIAGVCSVCTSCCQGDGAGLAKGRSQRLEASFALRGRGQTAGGRSESTAESVSSSTGEGYGRMHAKWIC